ncbi:MAG: PilZ domain-containing protein [Candidatus Brocadiae bacterium]|nr:PilZ domain-containing protein [Candidatus Brocadiia bacterium]
MKGYVFSALERIWEFRIQDASRRLLTGPDALKGIQQWLGRGMGPRVALFILRAASVAVFLLLLQLLLRAVRRRRRLVASWKEFGQKLGDLGLEPRHRALVRKLASRECPNNPSHILERSEVFERAVDRYMRPFCSAGPGEGPRRASDTVGILRAKIGLGSHSGMVYYSSRELRRGQDVEVRGAEQGQGPICLGTVGEQRADFLHLAGLSAVPDDLAGTAVEVVFYDEGRAYGFATKVVGMGSSSCLLTHTLGVRRAEARQSHRVAVNKPVTFRAGWEAADIEREGTLRDLSLGGLALVCPCYYEEGEALVVRFRPSAYVSPERAAREDALEDREIRGTVVQMGTVEGGRCLYRIEFSDADAEERRYLFRLVHEVELAAQE